VITSCSTSRALWLALSLAIALLTASVANALTFQVDFTSSTYQVQAGDTYADLLAQFQSETILTTNTLTGLEVISAPVYAGVNQNYGILMTTTVDVLLSGQYTFEVGTDWGRGGASVAIDNGTSAVLDEYVTTNDLWWNNNWNDPDVFTTTVNLTAGSSYTLGWIGFEGCCGGPATVRFNYEGALVGNLNSGNGVPFMVSNPEPGTGVLVGLGFAMLAGWSRARRLR